MTRAQTGCECVYFTIMESERELFGEIYRAFISVKSDENINSAPPRWRWRNSLHTKANHPDRSPSEAARRLDAHTPVAGLACKHSHVRCGCASNVPQQTHIPFIEIHVCSTCVYESMCVHVCTCVYMCSRSRACARRAAEASVFGSGRRGRRMHASPAPPLIVVRNL